MQGSDPFTVQSVPLVVLYPLLALTLPTFHHTLAENKEQLERVLQFFVGSAWQLLTEAITKFEFDISFFQGLCLLSQVDFACKDLLTLESPATIPLDM